METLAYRLEVESLDLGEDVKAVGLELIDRESREPVHGPEAARIWSAVLAALAAAELWSLDFFSHLDRLRDFCRSHHIAFREAAKRCIVIASPAPESLATLLERLEGETFGVRAGAPLLAGDALVEGDLARRGVDAYHHVFGNYFFCGVCDFENGFLTLLTNRLWSSEVIRRVRPVLEGLAVEVARPQ
ncbi:MAG: hypothetical protein HY237_12255 [Acidobacteria bacterium]|nr:hypothetical protein [Acidobacteriota bacterium]